MNRSPTYNQGNQSSVFARLDPDLRKKLDHAIVDRKPATLQACYDEFSLADLSVSRAAFYRYARKLRGQAELHHVAELVHPDDPDPRRYNHRLIQRRLLDLLLNHKDASAKQIHSLVNAAARVTRSPRD
ncbi:MAG TPA: hypothetical protein VJZ71_00705 [Phycisphaerae bacterium]|nr:hypothetical protein [Phycisphaerae bacterium]